VWWWVKAATGRRYSFGEMTMFSRLATPAGRARCAGYDGFGGPESRAGGAGLGDEIAHVADQ
jgi:hypothetical protein